LQKTLAVARDSNSSASASSIGNLTFANCLIEVKDKSNFVQSMESLRYYTFPFGRRPIGLFYQTFETKQEAVLNIRPWKNQNHVPLMPNTNAMAAVNADYF